MLKNDTDNEVIAVCADGNVDDDDAGADDADTAEVKLLVLHMLLVLVLQMLRVLMLLMLLLIQVIEMRMLRMPLKLWLFVKSSVKLGAADVDDAADGTNAVDSTDGVQMLCRDTSVGTALDVSRLPISITISKVW